MECEYSMIHGRQLPPTTPALDVWLLTRKEGCASAVCGCAPGGEELLA